MRKFTTLAALAAVVALPLMAAATDADASCKGRKNTGTVIGGVGGALVGNSISHGGGGAVLGGLGGAVLGHEVAKSGCKPSYDERRHHRRHHSQARYDKYGHRIR